MRYNWYFGEDNNSASCFMVGLLYNEHPTMVGGSICKSYFSDYEPYIRAP